MATSRKSITSTRGLTTEELLERFSKASSDEERRELRALLEGRQRQAAGTRNRPTDSKPSNESRLKVPSNGRVTKIRPDRVKLRFPKDGFVVTAKSRFDNAEELLRFIRSSFGLSDKGPTIQASLRRVGKYRRLDQREREIFTFGDPVLDAITDEHGRITIGRDTFLMMSKEIESRTRAGGIRNIDLSLEGDRLRQRQIEEAISGGYGRTIIEHSAEQTIVATSNPSELNFWRDSAHMRFRSWKKNYYFYSSIGSEIETWGGDFTSAKIESMYADPVVGNDPFVCGITKIDSDSDKNDDYVDEYEYGVFASAAGSVRSVCTAVWKGRQYGGTVSKGDCQLFL